MGQRSPITRRAIVAMLGGTAVAWPRLARAQQAARMRQVSVLLGTAQDDPETDNRIEGLSRGFREAGWIENRTLRLDYRFSGGDLDRMTIDAREAVARSPDVIVVHSNPFVVALRQADRTIPTVFVQVGDPVGSGFVESLAHPGGNLTGFTSFESGIGGKWLETLKEIAPSLARVLVLAEPQNKVHVAFLQSAQSAGSALSVTVAEALVRDADHLDRDIAEFAKEPYGGLIVLPSPLAAVRRERISALAAQHHLPAVYPYRFFIASGGLVSYGVDTAALFKGAAAYVDRILKGAKPADLPVQQPTKYQLVINLKTASALGLAVPPMLLARADEVIE
jgi:putative tryptophan/tyrosine transport system substrate-binding protein